MSGEAREAKTVMIKTINYDQEQILCDILALYSDHGVVDADVTFSKGKFYGGRIAEPQFKSDIEPSRPDVVEACATDLPAGDNSFSCVVFDPPFLAGKTNPKTQRTGVMASRFGAFPYVKDLWEFYDEAIAELYRVVKVDGILIVKCQDTVSSGKQHLSHVHIINEAERAGFYTKDLFILLRKSVMVGHNHGNQKHARKHHSYFIVFQKKKAK